MSLLARREGQDVETANKLISNVLHFQDLEEGFQKNYGSFHKGLVQPYASGPDPLWVTEVRETQGIRLTEDLRFVRCVNTN